MLITYSFNIQRNHFFLLIKIQCLPLEQRILKYLKSPLKNEK